MTKYIASLLVLLLTASCGGMLGGKTQSIQLLPAGSADEFEVEVVSGRGSQIVEVPGVVRVKRDEAPLQIKVKETRCVKSSTTYVPSKWNLYAIGNLFISVFGFTGTTVDMSSGSAWGYDDNVFVRAKTKKGCK